jgi:hypothetical protein
MKTFIVITSLILLNLLSLGQVTSGSSGVDVQVLSASCSKKKLLLHWRVTNNVERTIYVYTTFLKGPAAGFDEDDFGVLTLHTSLKEKIHVGVNFYPEAEFREVAPGGSIEGTLQDGQVCSQLTAPKPRGVALDVAYGFDVAAIKKSLRAVADSNEHPANPIVDWRTLAHSRPTPLRRTTG